MDKNAAQLKGVLEKLYKKYNRHELIAPDPLQFVYRYKEPGDMEIAGFLAAVLAYGRVGQIEKSVSLLLAKMGQNPCEFVRNFGSVDRKKLKLFKHRFNTGDDISDLLVQLKKVLNEHGSIENFFLCGYNAGDDTILPALSVFCETIIDRHEKKASKQASKGLKYLLSDPKNGSACKRLNLFLRWMIRSDDVDAGLWKGVDKSLLIVPIDVHMGRLCKILRLYDRKTVSLKAAVEITQAFAKIQPDDPVKYDFCLSRIGIVENCTGKIDRKCQLCELERYCSK